VIAVYLFYFFFISFLFLFDITFLKKYFYVQE
jgi:hypothetical protein